MSSGVPTLPRGDAREQGFAGGAFVGTGRLGGGGADHAGGDGVGADARRAALDGELAGEPEDRRLARAMGDHAEGTAAAEGVHRGEVDDRAAPGGHHVRPHGLDRQEDDIDLAA